MSYDLEIVGGLSKHYKRLPLAKFYTTWPFALAYLRGDILGLRLRGPFKVTMRPIEVPLSHIVMIEVRPEFGWMKLRVTGASQKHDGVMFSSRRLPELLDRLEQRGVDIHDK